MIIENFPDFPELNQKCLVNGKTFVYNGRGWMLDTAKIIIWDGGTPTTDYENIVTINGGGA